VIDVWNLYDVKDKKIRAIITRVNSALERYNQEMGNLFPRGHPNLLHFIEKIEAESRRVWREMMLMWKGTISRPNYDDPFLPVLPDDYESFNTEKLGMCY